MYIYIYKNLYVKNFTPIWELMLMKNILGVNY